MDSDFHYYGTGTAALAAGFKKADANLIANVAQYVDWFDSSYWSYWAFVDGKGNAVWDEHTGKPYSYEYPQLSIQSIDWKMSRDYNPNIWNPFHFPPRNLPYTVGDPLSDDQAPVWEREFGARHVVRETNLGPEHANKLCRPFSEFARDLILDTVALYGAFSTAEGHELEQLVAERVSPRVRCPIGDGPTLARYLLGVRMHVLADTWAHQDFTGEQNRGINCAGIGNEVSAKDGEGKYQPTQWTGTIWVLNQDTDCAAAPSPLMGGDHVCAGHSQVGHYPDYSWLTFKYPAEWLPDGKRFHKRNNPAEYHQAWRWLSFVMGLCVGTKSDEDAPDRVPAEIDRVLQTWHHLSPVGLEAIPESEKEWEKTELGQDMEPRWVPEDRAALGLYNGLAVTRYGYINVRQNSSLHYMETAAALHYQFCVDWMKQHPQYTWKPWQPLT